MNLVTLGRDHPEFIKYLKGSFSKTERAIPIQSLNVSSLSEQVTFQVVPVNTIVTPAFFKKWADIFRLNHLLWVAFPIFLVLAKVSWDEVEWDPLLAILAGFSVLFLAVAAFLRNDYQDHMSGIDRIHPRGGTRAIQKGWVTAEATRSWSWVYLGLGGAFGVPALWVFPELVVYGLIPVLWFSLLKLSKQKGFQYLQSAEWMALLLFGPLLTLGYQVAIGAGYDLEALWMGILTGMLFVFGVHFKNFEALFFHSHSGFQNTMSRLGFEGGKKFLEMWWWAFVVLMAGFQWVYHTPEWFLVFALAPGLAGAVLATRLRHLRSPSGSEMAKVILLGERVRRVTLVLWGLETLWYLFLLEI